MKKFIAVFLLGIFFFSNAFANSFTAKVNRNEVPAGEIFVLSLAYQGAENNENPDLSPLEKDFTVYSQSYSTTSYLSGNSFNTTKIWEVSLIPNILNGEATIPPISLGNILSNPVTIKIKDTSQLDTSTSSNGYQNVQEAPRYSINAKIDNTNPFVQQQVQYSIIIQDTGHLQISEPTFSNNINDDWSIRYLGYPMVKNKKINGQAIREIVFNYLMFPQKSGTLALPQARIDGYYLTEQKGQRSRKDIFSQIFQDDFGNISGVFSDTFAIKQPVVLKTNPTNIEVRPNPNMQNLSWWLPAKNIELSATWETPASEFKVGEAISRKILIKAEGITEIQLPRIKFKDIEGMKQYPEKPILSSAIDGTNVVSTAEISNVYIPSKVGNITIPEVEVYWFNTNTNKVEKSVIPATTIKVFPNKNYKHQESERQEIETVFDTPQSSSALEENTPESNPKINNYIIIIIAFIAGIFVSYILFKPKKQPTPKQQKPLKIDYKDNVISSAKNDDFKNLRNSLIDWAIEHFKNDKITNLSDIKKYVQNKDFAQHLDIISAKLFSDDKNIVWSSQDFIKIFEKASSARVVSIKDKSSALPKLYKN